MARLPDWERRLSAYLSAPGRDVFAWGANDCALFAAGAVEAVTGEHPFPDVAGTYSDREGAAEVLRGLGGTLFRTVDTAFPRKEVGFAQRGDLVMAQDALGVCMGARGVFLQLDLPGFAFLPRSSFTHAWEV
jgi:hypothetical protein